MRIVLTLFLGVVIAYGGVCPAQDYPITKLGKGANCKWSPNGKYLSYTSSEGLMVYVPDSGITRQVCPAEQVYNMHKFNYDWSGPEEWLFVRRILTRGKPALYDVDYVRISLDGTQEILHSEHWEDRDPINSRLRRLSNGELWVARNEISDAKNIAGFLGKAEIDTTSYYVVVGYWANLRRGIRDTDIWLIKPNGDTLKRVTTGQTFRMPILSPDGTHIYCGIGDVMLNLDGDVVGRLENAGGSSWLSDSRRIVFNRVVEGDGYIEASDIYVADIDGGNEIQITDSPFKVELWPVMSPDMSRLAYVVVGSNANYVEVIEVGEVLK